MSDSGDWTVEIDDTVNSEMVKLSLSEITDEGVKGHVVFLPPDVALSMADALKRNAEFIQATDFDE